MKSKIKGHVKVEQIDKDGNILQEWEDDNTVVLTGRAWLLAMISGINKDYYAGNEELWGVALGDSNDANDGGSYRVNDYDWHLTSEGLINEGGDDCREPWDTIMHPPYIEDTRILHASAVFSDDAFPILPYTIREIGVFISDTPPTADPYIRVDQRPYTMFGRVITPNYGITKFNDNTDLRVKYTLDISSTLDDMISAGWTILEYEGFNDYDSPLPYITGAHTLSPELHGPKEALFNFITDNPGNNDPAGWVCVEEAAADISILDYYRGLLHPVLLRNTTVGADTVSMTYTYPAGVGEGNFEIDIIPGYLATTNETQLVVRLYSNGNNDKYELRFYYGGAGWGQTIRVKFYYDNGDGVDRQVGAEYELKGFALTRALIDRHHWRIEFDRANSIANVYHCDDYVNKTETLIWETTSANLSNDIDRCIIERNMATEHATYGSYVANIDFSHAAGYSVNRSLSVADDDNIYYVVDTPTRIGKCMRITPYSDWYNDGIMHAIYWVTERNFNHYKMKASVYFPTAAEGNSEIWFLIGNPMTVYDSAHEIPPVAGIVAVRYIASAGEIQVRYNYDTAVEVIGAINANTWYDIEFEIDTTTQLYDIRVYDTSGAIVHELNDRPFVVGDEKIRYCGIWSSVANSGTREQPIYVDEVYFYGKDEF